MEGPMDLWVHGLDISGKPFLGVHMKTIVIGHRNPDTDSCAAATGYAALKTMMGHENVICACAGIPGARTEYLYKKFNIPLPEIIEDVSPRVADLMDTSPDVVYTGQTLLEAMDFLRCSQMSRVPVTTQDGRFAGMISLFDLADRMFQKARNTDFEGTGEGVVGKSIETTIKLAAHSLNARVASLAGDADSMRRFDVYVGAMSVEKLKADILCKNRDQMTIVVGDRSDIHRLLIENSVALMIVTGNSPVDLDLLKLARSNGTTVLQTPFDSATAVRRLKFSSPVEASLQHNATSFAVQDKISDISHQIKSKREDNFPVIDENNTLLGTLSRFALDEDSSVQLILVDHNELNQAVKGASEVPIVEIIDHHRIGIAPTLQPIMVMNDIVGSTSTLVTERYRMAGLEPAPDIAGILMGGLITDTLLLRSPTTTQRDRQALEYLKERSGEDPEKLLNDYYNVGSMIATLPIEDLLAADRKIYHTGNASFAVSQVEEAGFENFLNSKDSIMKALDEYVNQSDDIFAALFITDVVRENSLLAVAGSQKFLRALPFQHREPNLYDLRGIVSRKKQLLPALLKAFERI